MIIWLTFPARYDIFIFNGDSPHTFWRECRYFSILWINIRIIEIHFGIIFMPSDLNCLTLRVFVSREFHIHLKCRVVPECCCCCNISPFSNKFSSLFKNCFSNSCNSPIGFCCIVLCCVATLRISQYKCK